MTRPEQYDKALRIVHSLVQEDGRRWGDAAIEWQREDVQAILAGAILLHFITRPRGGAKTSDLAAVVVAFLVVLLAPGQRGYGFAADRDQAKLLIDAVAGYVARTPGLDQVLEVGQLKVRNVATGAEFEAMAADASSAHGLRGALYVVDELAVWPSSANAKGVWTAVFTAAPKGDATLVCITAAGAPQHWSYGVLDTVRGDEDWRVSELPGPVPWISERALAAQRRLLTDAEYSRLHLNKWVDLDDIAITREAVLACRRSCGALEPQADTFYVHGIDLSVVHDYTVVCTAHLERRDGQQVVVVDRLKTWKPTKLHRISNKKVSAYVLDVARRYRGRVLKDPYGANTLHEELTAAGVPQKDAEMTAAGNDRRARVLNELLSSGRLDLPNDDEELIDELSSLAFRETAPGVYRMDASRGGGHHDRATALSLAAFELIEEVSTVPRLIVFDDEPVTLLNPGTLPADHGLFASASLGAFAINGQPVDVDSALIGGEASPYAPGVAPSSPALPPGAMWSPYWTPPGGLREP